MLDCKYLTCMHHSSINPCVRKGAHVQTDIYARPAKAFVLLYKGFTRD